MGDELRYATGKTIRPNSWFKEQSMQVVERAMDECFLVLDRMLYAQHVGEREPDIEDGKVTMKDLCPRPNLRQVMACKNVMVAYVELHGQTVEF